MPQQSAHLPLVVQPQPDDTTCGPTCLQAVYQYWGDEVPLAQLIAQVQLLPGGGTLAVWLACHALRRGYQAEILTYNLQLFDPTWFVPGVDLAERLRAQSEAKRDPRLWVATEAYLEYLALGGKLLYQELTPRLLRKYLNRQIPILTGLSATYLYGCAREHDDRYDDVRGEPSGHFVVLSGYDKADHEVLVADPLHDNPRYGSHYYRVGMDRLVGAILLGILTYDANLLMLTPKKSART